MKFLSLIILLSLLLGCVNVGHLIMGREWLYFDGEAAKKDWWIKKEERELVKRMGDPDAYKWERWQKYWWSGGIGGLNWGNIWVLNLYYGDTVYVFKHHKLIGKRKTWKHEYAHMRGYYGPSWHIVDRSTGKVYDLRR